MGLVFENSYVTVVTIVENKLYNIYIYIEIYGIVLECSFLY